MALVTRFISPDAGYLTALARCVLEFGRGGHDVTDRDLSRLSILLPNLKLAPDLARALALEAGGVVLLPRMETHAGMVAPWLNVVDALPDTRRQLILHSLLHQRDWCDETMLWDVVGELTSLFDTLTEYSVGLPDDEADLLEKLEHAFALRASRPLAFEARLVNTLWRAEAQGRPSRLAARLLASREWSCHLSGSLVVVAETQDAGPLQALVETLADRLPVLLVTPDRGLAQGALARVLEAAWPVARTAQALNERAGGLDPENAAASRKCLRLVAAESLEGLGQAVADQVLDWVRGGKSSIALIALDRLAARRARALLERDGVLVQDETGWKMSTTRAAAVVDAWLEVLASDAYHRALIDLLRAPMIFADMEPIQRGMGCDAVEHLVREKGVVAGLDRLISVAEEGSAAAPILVSLREARTAMVLGQTASIAEWLRRLHKSLALLGVLEHLERDLAGRRWLEWHADSLAELGDETELFSFASWRSWFNRQMDSCLFRDESISSPVIMTHLAATRLRRFDGVILVGADAEHLSPAVQTMWLAHSGVRRELGLPALEEARRQLREDLAGLMLASASTVVAWQSRRRDEEIMPGAEIAVLTTVLAQSGGGNPVALHQARRVETAATAALSPVCPVLPGGRVPESLSASAMQILLNCPYRFFACYVLRLGEQEELADGMEKRDFGEQLHDLLNRFHKRFPRLSGISVAELVGELEGMSERAFAEAVARNFQDHAWRLRWRSRIAAYIAWQLDREKNGWFWSAGELTLKQEQALSGGHPLRLQGRIDRRDIRSTDAAEEFSLLDYKSRNLDTLNKQAADPDDVQLAFYALLQGADVSEAGYVALDNDRKVGLAPLVEPESRAAALRECIVTSFEAMYAGQGLPAHGVARVCEYCEMRGLCRKEWLQ